MCTRSLSRLLAVGAMAACTGSGPDDDGSSADIDGVRARVLAVAPEAIDDYPTVEVELAGLARADQLTGALVDVASLDIDDQGNPTITRNARPDAYGNYLLDPIEGTRDDGFAEVNAYYHTDLVARWFADELDHRVNGDQPLTVFVNFDEPNAEAGGEDMPELRFGQGRIDFAYDPAVIYHEFAHFVIGELAILLGGGLDEFGSFSDPHSLNEGTADYFAASVGDDPTIGKYAHLQNPDAPFPDILASLRRVDVPRRCPDDLSGEPHADGLIWTSALWEIRQSLGRQCADQLVYATLERIEDQPTFEQAGATLLEQAADSCPGSVDTVRTHLEAHGLLGCERVVPLALDGAERAGTLGGFGPSTSPVQYRIDVPAGADRVVLSLDTFIQVGPSEFEHRSSRQRFVVRKDVPIVVSRNDVADDDFESDVLGFEADHVGTPGETSLVIGEGGALELEPGSSYFVLLYNQSQTESTNEEFVIYSLTAQAP